MPDEHTPSKRVSDMIASQRAYLDEMRRAFELLGFEIAEAVTEAEPLMQPSDTLDPGEEARVVAAQEAMVQRIKKLHEYGAMLSQQYEALTAIANDGLFEDLRRQFDAQFKIIKEDL